MGVSYNKKSKGIYAEMRRRAPKIELKGVLYDRQTIYDNNELKRQLVEENPKLAEQLYYQWRETGQTEIGRLFALRYNGDEEFGQSAFHIGSELGILGMKRPDNPSSEQLRRLEDGRYI